MGSRHVLGLLDQLKLDQQPLAALLDVDPSPDHGDDGAKRLVQRLGALGVADPAVDVVDEAVVVVERGRCLA